MGRAVEIAYIYLNHSMPFVLQIFNVFKRFQNTLCTTIPEDEDMKESIIYLKSFKGGFNSNIIIPIVRREPPKKPALQRGSTMNEKEKERGETTEKENNNRNLTKRVSSVPRQSGNFGDASVKRRFERESVPTKQFDFSKTTNDGFKKR